MRSFRFSQLAGAIVFLASTTAVVSCMGGSGYTPAPTPPAKLSGTVTTSTTAAVTLPTLTASGVQVGGSLPEANVVATVTETLSATAPSGVTAFSKRRDVPASPSPLVYVSFSSTSSVTFTQTPALTFTSSSIANSNTYYLAYYTGSTWQLSSETGTVSGDTVSFASASGSVSITPSQPAVFALVQTSVTPSPSPSPVASPDQLVFDESSPAPQTFSVSETGYAGAFTESTSCAASPVPSPAPTSSPFVAEVSPSSATPASAGASVSFTVTPGEETGSCTITVSDSYSNTTTISVAVALDQVIIYDRKRH